MRAAIRSVLVALVTLAVLVAVPAGVDGTTASETEVTSTFDTGDGGWTIAGDAGEPEYLSTGGTPGGHICADDDVAGNTWYFAAPDAYLGDRSGFYGGTLSFDLKQSSTDSQFSNDDIVLSNASTSIVYDFGDESQHPRTTWTGYNITLSAADSNWTYASGGAVSASDFRTLLGNLTQLHVRGEYVSGSDRACLDSVRLAAGESASVSISDQEVADSDFQEVVVDSATLAEPGFVVIHEAPVQEDDLPASVIGVSATLSSGTHENVRVDLTTPVSGSQDVVAMVYADTTGNNIFDLGGGAQDQPYELGGEPVSDRAAVEVNTPTPTPTATPTPTPSPTPMPTATPTPTSTPTPTPTPDPRTPTPTPTAGSGETTDADGPGFGPGATVGALLVVTFAALRRRT